MNEGKVSKKVLDGVRVAFTIKSMWLDIKNKMFIEYFHNVM